MAGGVEEYLVFVLAVQFQQAVREIPQRPRSGERPVDEGAAAALGRHLAAHDDLAGRVLELRLDQRGVGTGSNELTRRAPAEEEPDGLDED
jgi:vacuolar-type H+-ATPase catalytic subunit A/Vma1